MIHPPTSRTSYKLSMQEVAELIRADGRIWNYWAAVTCLSVVWGESGGDAFVRPINLSPDSKAHLSLDIGLMQINTTWHPEHKINDLFDPQYNIRAGISLALQGRRAWQPNFKPWHAYTAGNTEKFMVPARTAINVVKTSYGEKLL